MIDHASVAVTDLKKSKDLYEAMLAPLSYSLMAFLPEHGAAGFGTDNRADFWIAEAKSPGDVHVAFHAESKEQVEEFYNKALAAGATDNGAPGYREMYAKNYYGAFVHDFDGNNIEAVFRDPSLPSTP